MSVVNIKLNIFYAHVSLNFPCAESQDFKATLPNLRQSLHGVLQSYNQGLYISQSIGPDAAE